MEVCNRILNSTRLDRANAAHLHLLLAQALEGAQKEHRVNLPVNHQHIVDETERALAGGEKGTRDLYRRLGDSQLALGSSASALDSYLKALSAEADRPLALQRKVIELELAQGSTETADESIEKYLASPALPEADRGWALNEKAQAIIQRKQYAAAVKVLEEAVRHDGGDLVAQGVAHYWTGYCLEKLGQSTQAERLLRVARDQFQVGHPLDADAGYLLGTIRQANNDPTEAISFYESVMFSHPGSPPDPLAKLGRALCRIALGQDDAGLTDLHDLVVQAATRPNVLAVKSDLIAGLRRAAKALGEKGNYKGAIEVLEEEQSLEGDPPAEYFARLAAVFQRRADQVESEANADADATADEKAKKLAKVHDLRIEAGDSLLALAHGLTLSDDQGQGDAIWKAADIYDRAGDLPREIAALQMFVDQRPNDGQTPDALLRLGRAFQANGQYDKAIKTFQQDQFLFPQSLAASKAGVPLAQSFIARGPESYPKAEKALLAVLENNQIVTPEAEEFRDSLFELSQLYYRTQRYEAAIGRLEEMTNRYPADRRMAQILFLMADSYRKSAALLSARIDAAATTQPSAGRPISTAAREEASAARRDRLEKARDLFARVEEMFRQTPPQRDIDKLYLKLSCFYRADCAYDLHDYESAIRMYDSATLRYQDDPSSVAAYVQIVNAYCALGRPDDARTANERAKWLLRRMPAAAFEEGKAAIPRDYWEKWLQSSGESGMYAKAP